VDGSSGGAMQSIKQETSCFIFRASALKRYRAGRDRAVLPHFRGAGRSLGDGLLAAAVQMLPRRRVPLLQQLSAVECGAACLAILLSYHGRPTTVGECRERLGIGRDGTTALKIAEAARSYGLRVKGYSLTPADLAAVPLPAIVHWDFDHF